MQDLAADLARIKRYVQQMEEENARLKEELSRRARPSGPQESGGAEPAEASGMDSLMALYDRGFHICSLYFGGFRHGDCLFCAAFMQKDRR